MDDGRHHAQWRATCRGQRVSPLAPARPAAANAACRLHLDAHRRGPRRHLRRLKNDDAAASITRGEILASPIKLDRADQVLCVGDARRRVVSPCLQPSLKPPPPCQCSGITPTSALLGRAKTDEQADNSKSGLRRTVSRFFSRVFLPKDLPEAPVCIRHRWRCLHSKTLVFRAHGRQCT